MSLELLYNCEKERIRTKQDAVVCAIHSTLLAAGLKCIGLGEEIPTPESARASDMLPTGWNNSSDIYMLSYRSDSTNDIFLLKVLVVDGTMYTQLMRQRDEKVVDMDIESSTYVTDRPMNYSTAFSNKDQLMKDLRSRLVDPLLSSSTSSSTSSSEQKKRSERAYESSQDDPLRIDPMRRQPYAGGVGGTPLYDPLNVGSRDLDPLGVGGMGIGGGGMLFDPLRSGFRHGGGGPQYPYGGPGGPGIPRGSIPPGARFDPFGPPDLGGHYGGNGSGNFPGRGGVGGRPDPDHLPPPGYDNMFM